LGALDLKLRKEMQLELKSLQEEVGITFVYVTHDQEEALTMSDRIAVINEGKVQQLAGPTTLYETPANRFVAGFIGQTNVFSGTVEAADGDKVTLRTREGLRVEAVAREQAPPKEGEESHAAVRPEKVRFGESGDNVSAAEVKQVVYLGASTQYIVELEGGGKLVLYQQNAFDAARPSEGDGVTVSWDAQNCLVLGG
jgi:spermidine/putrescine transport system ATP-binding protein